MWKYCGVCCLSNKRNLFIYKTTELNSGETLKKASPLLPAPKSAIPPSKNENSESGSAAKEGSEKSAQLLVATSGQFRTAAFVPSSNQQKPSIPSTSPTDLLK